MIRKFPRTKSVDAFTFHPEEAESTPERPRWLCFAAWLTIYALVIDDTQRRDPGGGELQ